MGNAQLKSARGNTHKDRYRYTLRHLGQKESVRYGYEVILYLNSFTKSPFVNLEEFVKTDGQLSQYVNNIVNFMKKSYTVQEPRSDHSAASQDYLQLDFTKPDSTPLSDVKKRDFLKKYVQSIWTLLETNDAILFECDRNNVTGEEGLAFLRGHNEEKLVDKIRTELFLRQHVSRDTRELVKCCLGSGRFDMSDWEKVKHKLIYANQFPMLIFWIFKELKHSSGKSKTDIDEVFKGVSKELPYYPLLISNVPQSIRRWTIPEDDEDVQTMMSVFADTTFTRDAENLDGENLKAVDQFLVKLLMRDFNKHGDKTIEYPQKRLALRAKGFNDAFPSNVCGDVYEDEYFSSKIEELSFKNDISFFPIGYMEQKLSSRKLQECEVIDDSIGLEQFIEEKYVKTWTWLDEEAEKPDGGNFDKDTATADIFYRLLFSFETVDKTKFLLGIPLYLLQRFLRSSEHVRDRFKHVTVQKVKHRGKTNSELACDLFCRSANSLISLGSLLVYYHVLSKWFSEKQLDRIEKKLEARKTAEKIFVDYFFQPCQYFLFFGSPKKTDTISASQFPDLLSQMNKFPYVFFLVFMERYQYVTREKHEEKNQLHVLRLFYDALHSSPDRTDQTRKIFRSVQTDSDGFIFKQKVYTALAEAHEFSSYVPFELHDLFHKAWEEIVLQKFLEKSKLQTYQVKELDTSPSEGNVLGDGAQGDAKLVNAPGIAVALVAKCFVDKSQYSEISGEIEGLLGNQFNPHIVQVYGCILDEREFSGILMEYCEGGSLHDFIQKRTNNYEERDIVRWTFHASSGLLYLHGNGVVHKDVKPKNMLLDASHQKLKICDLGISKMTSVSKGNVDQSTFTTDYFRGTPGYKAPEVDSEEDSLTPSVDVFSLGRSLWHMVFRTVPTTILTEAPVDVLVSNEILVFLDEMIWSVPKDRPTMNKVFKKFKDLHIKQGT